MKKTPPTPSFIKAARQHLRMTVREFEHALGYDADGRICMAMESGTRNGRPFEMAGPAAAALTYLNALVQAYDRLQAEDYPAAEVILRLSLPARLQ